jgi:hypothetical protein
VVRPVAAAFVKAVSGISAARMGASIIEIATERTASAVAGA